MVVERQWPKPHVNIIDNILLQKQNKTLHLSMCKSNEKNLSKISKGTNERYKVQDIIADKMQWDKHLQSVKGKKQDVSTPSWGLKVSRQRDKLCCTESGPSERSIKTHREINGRVTGCRGFYLAENK